MSYPGWMLEYSVLGPLSVARKGEQIDLTRPLERRLLAVLLINRSRTLSDEQIVDALWPGRPPGYPGQALRTSASRLRKLLGGSDLIVRDSGGYRLVVEPGSVDSDRFEALLERADSSNRSARLREALGLWTSDEAYADFRYDAFVAAEAERLQSLRLQAHEDLFSERLALGESHGLIPDLQFLVREHPHREQFYGLLMLALYRAGQQPEALRTFQAAKATLGDDLGLEPTQALVDLEEQILLEDPRLTLAAPAVPNNIPSRITSIIGRQSSIEALVAHLGDRRLVTVTGPVGVGKSTTAIEAARRVVSAGRMECWYINLEAVILDDQVPAHMADQLEKLLYQPLDRASPAFTPGRLIGQKKMLLVLDNCEHVIDGVGSVASSILKECPNTAILATSRERLGLPGELLYPVEPLVAGADGEEILDPHHALENYPALQLFTDRCRAASPGFQVSPADVPTMLQLCRKLDGLPLAIELAAARVTSLTIAEIARQVDGYFSILSSQRGVEIRHKSLEAAIGWSYDLLDKQQQEYLQVLARVNGPFTTADAAQLIGNDDQPEVAAAVASLRDKSLLWTYGEISQSRQFAMLKTIREFATVRAVEAGNEREHKMRHARCFLSLAGRAEQHLREGPRQLQWLQRCEQSTPDFLQAIETLIDEGHVEEAIDLVARVGAVWVRFHHHAAAYPMIRAALTASGAKVFDSTPRVHVIASFISVDAGDRRFRDGLGHAQHAVRTSRVVGDVESAIIGTALVGLNQWLAGHGDDARESVTAACSLAAGTEGGWAETFAFVLAGIVEHALQPSETTLAHFERAAELAVSRSDEIGKAVAFSYLGSALKDIGHYSRARVAFRKGYESGRRIGDPEPTIRGAAGLALVSWLDRDPAEAVVASDRALRLLEPITADVRYAALSSLYLGYHTSVDMAAMSEAMTLVFMDPPAKQPAALIRFLLEVAERRAVDHLDPARVAEVQAGISALNNQSPPEPAVTRR